MPFMIVHIPNKDMPKPDPGPYPRGRVCAAQDCITRLQRNNPGPFCHHHWLDQLPPDERGPEAA